MYLTRNVNLSRKTGLYSFTNCSLVFHRVIKKVEYRHLSDVDGSDDK